MTPHHDRWRIRQLATLEFSLCIESLRRDRYVALVRLGPRPGWWRPFARGRWQQQRRQLGETFVERAWRELGPHCSLDVKLTHAFEHFVEQMR